MALSDVLFEAREEIERYLADDFYDPEIKAKARAILRAMRELHKELDTPPPEDDDEVDSPPRRA